MERRTFLKGVGAAGVAASLAGCNAFGLLGGENSPPPRRSSVFETIQTGDSALQAQLTSDPWVESRANVNNAVVLAKGSGGSKGATGRGRGVAAPAGYHGRKKYHGDDDDDDWRENHSGELEKYDVAIQTVGVARIGDVNDEGDDLPGVGKPDSGWDDTYDISAGETMAYPLSQSGWYRVGSELSAANGGHDFDWEAVDVNVESGGSGYDIDTKWKISPRV